MSKTVKSPVQQAKLRLRGGSDRDRALYVGLRKVLAPRTALERTRAARTGSDAAGTVEIPEAQGFAIFEPGRFPEAAEIVAEAQRKLASTDLDAVSRKGKQFMLPIIDSSELDAASPFLRLALRADVLGAVASYLGTAPLLTNINVYLSRSTGRELISSQLFHCDADDTRQIKIFVLCSYVTPENGPLMIMDASTSEDLRKRVGYSYRNRVTDEEARAAIGETELTPVQGPAGTVVMVDTSRCFHYGSRVGDDAGPRLATMLQYLTPYSFMLPRNLSSKAPFKGMAQADTAPLARLALGA